MKATTVMRRLGAFKSVRNMTSSNYSDVPNQFIIEFENGRVFQSYSSIIAVELYSGTTYLGNGWDYSTTTSKYRNQFLGETKKETEQKIELGVYKEIQM